MSQTKRLNKKRFTFLMFLIPTIVVVLLIPYLVHAQAGDAVVSLLGAILIPVISFIGKLMTVVIRLLISIAQYNDFINSAAVSKGWIIMRDIFNMVFIIILLVIAFATVLKIEKYSYKRLLGGLLLAAILVNFSKLICGVIIDFAQVLMLTFVNAFKAVGEGNLAEMLGLKDLINLDPEVDPVTIAKEKISALFLGLIMSIVALIVVTIIMMIFLFRIIILWFIVLLSPIAFMASVLPYFQKYSRQWWDKFVAQVIIGPVLAFFLWLSFSIVQETQETPSQGGLYQTVAPPGSEGAEKLLEDTDLRATVSGAGKPQYVLNFVIGIAMLIGSLMVAQQIGVVGGKMAGSMVGKMQAVAKGAGKLGLKGVDRSVEKIGKATVRGLGHVTGVKGFQRFQGVSYDIAKDALRQRKQEKERQRRSTLEQAAAPIAQGLDRNLDPGVWAKRTGDLLHKSKGKIEKATREKEKIDVKIEKIDVDLDMEKTNLGELNQEKQERADLVEQLHSDSIPTIQPAMKDEEKERIKAWREKVKDITEKVEEETGVKYDIKTKQGRKQLEDYLKGKATDSDNLIADSKKKITDLQAEKDPLAEQSREQANIISTEKYRPGVFGISERERLPLAEIEARKRQAEKTKDVLLTTNGEEGLLIEELKKSIARDDGDRAIASLELLTKVNGHNTLMLDHSVQDQVRKLIGEKFTKTDDEGNNLAIEDFNKQPVNMPAIRLFYEHIAKDISRLNDYEAARAVSRIGSIGGLSGNFSMPGIAHIDPLTGLPKFGGIVQKEDGGLDMDERWAAITKFKANQIEPQTFWKQAHSSTFATEDKDGAGGHLHAGGRAYLSNVSGKDIAQMIRMRDDTLTRLNKPEIIVDIRNFADDISKGLIKGISKQQAVMVNTFANTLIDLKTQPDIKSAKPSPTQKS